MRKKGGMRKGGRAGGSETARDTSATYAITDLVIRNVGGGRERRRVSVSIDTALWDAVHALVDEGAAPTVSLAVEEAAAWWVANQQLRIGLEETFAEYPESRPTEEDLREARRRLSEGS